MAPNIDMGRMGEFEREEKNGHKPNKRFHGVVEVEKNGGRGKEEGIETEEDQPI